MQRIIKCLNFLIYWLIVLLPFSVAVGNSPMNVFMGYLVFAFLAKRIIKKEPITIGTAINIPLLFLFVITCLSLFNSINHRDSIKGGVFRLLLYIFVFFAVAAELKDKKHIKRVVFSIACGIALATLDGFWQVITGKDFIRGYASIVNLGLVRATASFKDANLLGIYLSALSPLIFGLALYFFKSAKKIIFGLLSLLALSGTVITYSRPTLLAVYIALFFFGIARKDKALISLLLVFTLLSPLILPRAVKDWAKEVEYNPVRFMCNDDRIAVYLHSFRMIKAHPFIGVGANTYMKNYKKYKEFPEYRNIITPDYMYAHNMYLQMAAEIGLLGLGIFFWLLFRLFSRCRKLYGFLEDPYLKIILLSLVTCIAAFLVNGLTESSLYYSRVAIIFWYLAGFALALGKFKHDKQVEAGKENPCFQE